MVSDGMAMARRWYEDDTVMVLRLKMFCVDATLFPISEMVGGTGMIQ